MNTIYLRIDEEDFYLKKYISEDEEKTIRSGGFIVSETTTLLSREGILYIPYEIENVGNGAALNFILSFEEKGGKIIQENFYTLKVVQSIFLKIYSIDSTIKIKKDYTLKLGYKDMMGNKYSQNYDIHLESKTPNGKNVLSMNIVLDGVQHLEV